MKLDFWVELSLYDLKKTYFARGVILYFYIFREDTNKLKGETLSAYLHQSNDDVAGGSFA